MQVRFRYSIHQAISLKQSNKVNKKNMHVTKIMKTLIIATTELKGTNNVQYSQGQIQTR